MKLRKFFIFLSFAIIPLLLNSCQRPLGYAVLLWDSPEHNLQDGQIVKVYYKSNITHSYIVGIPGERERFNLPFWQISKPASKKKAMRAFDPYMEYIHQYAKIKVDGLPVREEPVNTAKQVYRLHKDEIVKILFKGDGQDVMVGKNKKLPGDWLCVLTEGGSKGWCFSYNLTIFETDANGKVIGGEVEEKQITNEDTLLNQILEAKWYPDYYARLINDKTIDLETMKLAYGFDTGIRTGKVQVNLPEKYHSASYAGADKVRDNTYSLIATPFQIIIRNKNQIVVNYSSHDGNQEAYTFITLSDDINIDEILEKERERRNNLMNELYKVTSFDSQNYGQLVFNSGKTFTWNGFTLLVPAVVPSGAKGRGTVNIKYLLSKDLASKYDGVLTFKFDGITDEVNFLYKLANDGLNLESIDELCIKNNFVVTRSSNPTVLFFNK